MKKALLALFLTGCLDTTDATQDNFPTIIALPTLTTVSIVDDTVTMSAEEYRWLMNNRLTMEQWITEVVERHPDCTPEFVKISNAPY